MSRIAVDNERRSHVSTVRLLGAGAGFLAGAAIAMIAGREHGLGGSTVSPPREGRASETPPAGDPAVYEFCARVVWSDLPGGFTSDLEDAEGVESFLNAGWELINVIVPFAQTTQLALSYPGNTRKLIAYFRRPIGRG